MDNAMAASRRFSAPWTIVTVIALWAFVQTLEYIQTRQDVPTSDFAIVLAHVLQFFHAYLIVVLVAYGLIRRSRFTWVIAFVWQGIEAGFGFVNLMLGGWTWDVIGDFSWGYDPFSAGRFGFYIGPFPVIVAVVSVLLLLASPTRRWLGEG